MYFVKFFEALREKCGDLMTVDYADGAWVNKEFRQKETKAAKVDLD